MGNRASVRVGLAHVESRRYEAARLGTEAKFQLISAWLTGECYGTQALDTPADPAPDPTPAQPSVAAADR
jgi:hypothetical protein